jgi:hypothetical protein
MMGVRSSLTKLLCNFLKVYQCNLFCYSHHYVHGFELGAIPNLEHSS